MGKDMKQILIFFMACTVFYGCSLFDSPAKKETTNDLNMVLNRTWLWTSTVDATKKIIIASPENYTLILADRGRAIIQFDCNHGGGQYTLTPGKLSFGPLFSTRMACPTGSMDNRFSSDLSRVVSFYIKKDTLYLELTGGGLMIFRSDRTKKGD